jgi:hypothetical protein
MQPCPCGWERSVSVKMWRPMEAADFENEGWSLSVAGGGSWPWRMVAAIMHAATQEAKAMAFAGR